jgi:hypothetical protein
VNVEKRREKELKEEKEDFLALLVPFRVNGKHRKHGKIKNSSHQSSPCKALN